ncbi:MAG: ISL3 family transposase [Planctomycetes bacterium]|nr:ISL3 family transposase [Planctomycetota bacterium]
MNKLTEHYSVLLGLDAAWIVSDVSLSLEENRVEITVTHVGGSVACPECGTGCTIADHAPERTWRHLDTMQFETRLRARVPRADCKACGVKTTSVPWAGKHSRFTLMFEAFAIHVIEACGTVKSAAGLLGLDWDSVHRIMERAVERGLERRELESLRYVGIDEKSFRRGHSYISLLSDLTGSRVLEVVEDRTEEAAEGLWKDLPGEQKQQIEAVAVDMWPAFANSVKTNAPQAEIVHDRFHISKHLNEAVDRVRRSEHKVLQRTGDDRLKGSKHLWLFNPENLSDDRWIEFETLKDQELKTSRGWAIKEQFRWFWEYRYAGNARKFFDRWYGWATHSRLKPIIKVAKMLKRHLDNILTYFRHKITNAVSEGFNSRIQSIKSQARGFRAFRNFRTRILFHCGKLDLLLPGITH